MTISPNDLGATVCRAIMRDLDDHPIKLMGAPGAPDEYTGKRTIADQWTVCLIPTPDFVTVTAHGQYHGFGLWDDLDIGGVNRISPNYHYVAYPDGFATDPSLITSADYEAKLRIVVLHALTVAAMDRAAHTVGAS